MTAARPHPAPRPPCEECIYQAQAADRARKARDDFAKALYEQLKAKYKNGVVLTYDNVCDMIRTLRGHP